MLEEWLRPNSSKNSGNGPLIELRQVVKQYRGAAGVVTALNAIDLQVQRGEFVVILGKSGAGKTTLVNMMTGIDQPRPARFESPASPSTRWTKTGERRGAAAPWASSCSSSNCCPP